MDHPGSSLHLSCLSALLPSMLKSQSGHLVNVSSLQGLIAMPHRSSYSASKHALQAYSDSLRHEIESRGVDVTVVSPGYVQTQISVNSYDAKGQRYGSKKDYLASGYLDDIDTFQRWMMRLPLGTPLITWARCCTWLWLQGLERFRSPSCLTCWSSH